MKRSREESQVFPNDFFEEVPLPPLNLSLTLSPEFISFIGKSIEQQSTCPNQPLNLHLTITPELISQVFCSFLPDVRLTEGSVSLIKHLREQRIKLHLTEFFMKPLKKPKNQDQHEWKEDISLQNPRSQHEWKEEISLGNPRSQHEWKEDISL